MTLKNEGEVTMKNLPNKGGSYVNKDGKLLCMQQPTKPAAMRKPAAAVREAPAAKKTEPAKESK